MIVCSRRVGSSIFVWLKALFIRQIAPIQSRPIEMRAQILYLANRWTKFEMVLTAKRFLDLVRFLLL